MDDQRHNVALVLYVKNCIEHQQFLGRCSAVLTRDDAQDLLVNRPDL